MDNQNIQKFVSVDGDDEAVRTDKQILWTQEEDVRLMNSWLNNLMDPIGGNDKKNEQCWGDITNSYYMTTPKHRRRNMKQAKDRWHKINRWTYLFHSSWLKARRIFTSGHSNQMWIDKAHKFYEEDNKHLKLGRFGLVDVWYTVRNQPKWITYDDELKKARKRKESSQVEEGEHKSRYMVVEEYPQAPRPMGQKQAKRAAQDMKGKSKASSVDVEELDKFMKF